MATTRVGLSGWSYSSWKGQFYPEDLAPDQQLAFASREFPSLEINKSFYSLLKPGDYRQWHDDTPGRFRFAVKGSRYITHQKKLNDPAAGLANFLASGLLALEEKLGPILWQLPGNLHFHAERIKAFLDVLPRDTDQASRRAHRHDQRIAGRAQLQSRRRHRIRHALEVRHESFFVPEFIDLLHKHRVALVVSDSADWPRAEDQTAGFAYLRLHGSRTTYASRYTDRELDDWAERIGQWEQGESPPKARTVTGRPPPPRKGRDVYVYFDNDQEGHAPRDARRLAERLDRNDRNQS